uniref:RING-type E3 ubiquitin transferase n=1 Tax=Kalanchoe fedtschenkoi TaxID=63787 RepID=A0A7N0T830_KALFE
MVPASEAAVAALEKVEAEEGAAATGCCAICMEEDQVRLNSRMPCRHVFHTMCIEKWLRISSSCPTCRFAMPADG